MKTKATANLILDPVSKTDKRVLKLQVTFNRTSDRKSLGGSTKISLEDYQKQNKAYKEAAEEIRPKYQKACDIVAFLGEDFTFDAFRTAWNDEAWSKKKNTGKYANNLIRDMYNEYLNDEAKTFSPDTKEIYLILVQWIEEFKANIRLNDITIDFLNELTTYIKTKSFERRGKETSDTTIAIYMRGLRAIFNYAIDKQYISPDKYPFGKNKFKMIFKKSTNIALSEEEFQLFIQVKPQGYKERLGYNFFLLSYSLDGLNLADIIRIKNRDITNNILTVGRWKIRNTLSDIHQGTKELIPLVIDILKEYGEINPCRPNEYVLRFLWGIKDNDIERQDTKKKYLNKNINKGLKSMCEKIGIQPFTLYSARHTYATDSVNNNIPIAVISQYLGHTNITTTQGYIDSISTTNRQKNTDLKQSKLTGIKAK